ncbi:methylisocitrate lyase [Nitrospira defluvii]|uniref:Methylisocitrate lyase n=1 Tax=Nitrospira defluvii TaxID=330214 RepID=A0ABM8R3D8_9BACT|nr:methylisocitrate lyase [Nitrospira defluvii]CAE6730777.1 2-methylisocitrate lyase [Nitrospira defluvii]
MTTERSTISKGQRLRELLATRTIAMPGAFNALTALQIERAGFDALYVSGATISAARGLPDIGLISLAEMAADAAVIANAVAIPALVDADTGYGPPSMVREAVREFERAGLAGMQLEDQETAKKCGHLPGKRVVPIEDMVAKLTAAVQARSHPDFLIVARTDARAVEGMEAAIRRAKAYADAGADILFPEALLSAEEFGAFAREMTQSGVHVPLMANMTEFGKTPYLRVSEFEALGYRAVLFPVSALRVAARAVETLLAELTCVGTQREWLDRMMPRQELYDLLRYDDHDASTGRPHERGHTRTSGS